MEARSLLLGDVMAPLVDTLFDELALLDTLIGELPLIDTSIEVNYP